MAVVIESEHVFLRDLLLNDVDALGALLAQPEATRAPPSEGPRAFIAAQQETYRTNGFGVWAAIHREAGVAVGYAGLRPSAEGGAAELWCLVDPSYRGNGLGEEVARAVLAHAFERLQHERVVASVHPNDNAARRLAEKIGLVLSLEDETRRLHLYARDRR